MAQAVPRIVVLVSGGGTNLQALIDAASKEQLGVNRCGDQQQTRRGRPRQGGAGRH